MGTSAGKLQEICGKSAGNLRETNGSSARNDALPRRSLANPICGKSKAEERVGSGVEEWIPLLSPAFGGEGASSINGEAGRRWGLEKEFARGSEFTTALPRRMATGEWNGRGAIRFAGNPKQSGGW